jgi:hypothetical protein
LIIVKIAVKKFHLQKMPPLSSPAKGQWGLRARGKSMGHGDKARKAGKARKGRAGGRKQQAAGRELQKLDELRRVE